MADLNRNGARGAPARVYLDWNATAPMRAEAVEAMRAAMEDWANPSSIHADGRAAKGRLETARESVATALGALPQQVVFTSGGTEALALALGGTQMDRILVGAIEHDAVRAAAPGAETIPVDRNGVTELDALRRQLADGPALVAIMHANNETGVVQPVEDIAGIVRDAGGLFLCDCVQTAGKRKLPAADLLAVSAHKLGGPPGVGGLVVRCAEGFSAIQKGGGQERGLRGGTENLLGIAGFAAALQAAETSWLPHARALRDTLEARLSAAGGEVIGSGADRLENTTMVRLPGVPAAAQLMQLDLAGFSVSSGAACSSGKVGSSHVLAAMGCDETSAGEAIRISTGWTTTDAEVDAFADAWTALAERRRAA